LRNHRPTGPWRAHCNLRLRFVAATLILGNVATVASWPAVSGQTAATAGRSEAIAFIVNQSNPVSELTFPQLRDLMLQEQTTWRNGKKVTIVMLQPGQPAREVVLRVVYHMNEKDHSRFLLHSDFTSSSRSDPKLLSDGRGAIKFVSLVPGAIGYVKADEVDSSVKVLRLDGMAPGDPSYKLNFTAVAKASQAAAQK
jgi:ABC-type phosphate transport system substrate-binding protein